MYYFTISRCRNPRLVEKSRFGNGFKLQFRRIFVPLVSISRKSFQTFEQSQQKQIPRWYYFVDIRID